MMNVFFAVGFANAMHRLPRFGGVTEMPLFSDTIDHGSTNGRYHACRINGARSVTVDRNKELHARINHKDALRRMSNAYGEWVPTSTYSVDVPCEMVRLVIYVTRQRVTVVSRTLNWTRENLKTKNPARGLRRRGFLVKYSLISFNPRTCDKYDYYFDPRRQHSAECDDLKA